jgi:hypothetical protein
MRKYTKMHILFEESGSQLSIDLATNQVENWLFDKSIETNYKTSDECLIKFEKGGSTKLVNYLGSVPDFFPGKHYGDYVCFEINAKGTVKELVVTDEKIDKLLEQAKRRSQGLIYDN